MKDALTEALARCDREPIHIPGTIQGFGVLLATDRKMNQVHAVSANCESRLGMAPHDVLRQPIATLLGRTGAHDARNALSRRTTEDQRETVGVVEVAGQSLQLSVHQIEDRAIFELLPVFPQPASFPAMLERTRELFASSIDQPDISDILHGAVARLRELTGYDRVKAYRFLPNGAGEVVAEERSVLAESFLGLRFPASDIPPRARRLYRTTPIRVIADVQAADVPLVSLEPDAPPLNLSLALLRGTSPVHLRYLANMGVRSTMSLPIVINGQLWGLFACHHFTPKQQDPIAIASAELAGKALSVVLQQSIQLHHEQRLKRALGLASQLASVEGQPGDTWERAAAELTSTIPCDGLIYAVADTVHHHGITPSPEGCRALRRLADPDPYLITTRDDLGGHPHLAPLARGADLVLACRSHRSIFCSSAPRRRATSPGLAHQRRTSSREKPATNFIRAIRSPTMQSRCRDCATNGRLTMSRSRGRWPHRWRRPWTTATKPKARSIWASSCGSSINRVRNILALVQSVSHLSRTTGDTVDSYACALEQRIVALAGAHNLLTRQDMAGARLHKLAELELKPFISGRRARAKLHGPPITVKADVAPVLALLLHELTTNAVKHGALSVPEGQVTLTWALQNGGLHLQWQEHHGPPVSPPQREGFGRTLLEGAIPYEFNGHAQLDFAPGGVQATFWLPGSSFSEGAPRPSPPLASKPKPAVVGQRALVVEDGFVIAREMRSWLQTIGFEEVDAVASVGQALERLHQTHYDFCLLDVQVRGQLGTPVAELLQEKGIPFVFASGFDSAEDGPVGAYPSAPRLTKPVEFQELLSAVRDVSEAGQ